MRFIKLFFLILSVTQVFSIEKRQIPVPLKTSVLIPCAGSHFKHLRSIFELYAMQTCLPDEIVVSLSSVETLEPAQIDELERISWPFALKIYRFIGRQSPGLNRNMAGRYALGDVWIYQDADDVPHPQRVEIVKYIFENYVVDHLINRFVLEGEEFYPYYVDQIQIDHFSTYDSLDFSSVYRGQMHNGNVCCTRDIAKAILWDDVRTFNSDNDVKFNRDVYRRFSNTAAISNKLVMWRYRYSALVPKI